MSGIGQVAKGTRQAHRVAEAAIAEATSVQNQIENQMTALAETAKPTMLHAIGEVSQWVE